MSQKFHRADTGRIDCSRPNLSALPQSEVKCPHANYPVENEGWLKPFLRDAVFPWVYYLIDLAIRRFMF